MCHVSYIFVHTVSYLPAFVWFNLPCFAAHIDPVNHIMTTHNTLVHHHQKLFISVGWMPTDRLCKVLHVQLHPHPRLLGEPEVTAAAADLACCLLGGSCNNGRIAARSMFSWLINDCSHTAGILLPRGSSEVFDAGSGVASAVALQQVSATMSEGDCVSIISFDLRVLQHVSASHSPVLGNNLVCQTLALCEALLLPISSRLCLHHTQISSCAFDTWAAAAIALLTQANSISGTLGVSPDSGGSCDRGNTPGLQTVNSLLERSLGFISQVLNACESGSRSVIIPPMLQWIQQAWHAVVKSTFVGRQSSMPTDRLQPGILQGWLQQSTTFSLGYMEHPEAAIRVQAVQTLQALLTPGSCSWLDTPSKKMHSTGSRASSPQSGKIIPHKQSLPQSSYLVRTGTLLTQPPGTETGGSPIARVSQSTTPSPESASQHSLRTTAGEEPELSQLSEELSCKVLAAAFERLTDVEPSVSTAALAFMAAASPAAVAALSRDPFGDLWTPQWQEAIALQPQAITFRSPQLSRLFELLFQSAGASPMSTGPGGLLLKRRVDGAGGTGLVAPGEQQHLHRSSSGSLTAAGVSSGGSSLAGGGSSSASFHDTILSLAAEVIPTQISRAPEDATAASVASSRPSILPTQSSKSVFGIPAGCKDASAQRTVALASQPPRSSTTLRSSASLLAEPREGSAAGGISAPDADLMAASQPSAASTAGSHSTPQTVTLSEASVVSEPILPGNLTSTSAIAWLLVQEAAKQLVVFRLRTHFGGPTQTFGMLDKLLQGVHAQLLAETREKASFSGIASSPSTPGTTSGAAPAGTAASEAAADAMGRGITSSFSGSDNNTTWLMLEFLSALERGIYLGCDGITRKDTMPQSSLAFYETNRKVNTQACLYAQSSTFPTLSLLLAGTFLDMYVWLIDLSNPMLGRRYLVPSRALSSH